MEKGYHSAESGRKHLVRALPAPNHRASVSPSLMTSIPYRVLTPRPGSLLRRGFPLHLPSRPPLSLSIKGTPPSTASPAFIGHSAVATDNDHQGEDVSEEGGDPPSRGGVDGTWASTTLQSW